MSSEHHNPNLRRAIATQAGIAAYPTVPYFPELFREPNAFYGQAPAAMTDVTSAADTTTASSGGNMWSSLVQGAFAAGGAVAGGAIQASASRKLGEAQIASQERIALAQMEANAQAAALQARYSQGGGMSTGAIVGLVVLGIGVAGVIAWKL